MPCTYEVISEQEIVEEWDRDYGQPLGGDREAPTEADFRQQFIKSVQVFLNDGWQLSGSVAVDDKGRLLQAVFRQMD